MTIEAYLAAALVRVGAEEVPSRNRYRMFHVPADTLIDNIRVKREIWVLLGSRGACRINWYKRVEGSVDAPELRRALANV